MYSRQETAAAAEPKKGGLVRRHSSGDHAWRPTPRDTAAKKAANKNFGVGADQIHDCEGSRLPTTRGY